MEKLRQLFYLVSVFFAGILASSFTGNEVIEPQTKIEKVVEYRAFFLEPGTPVAVEVKPEPKSIVLTKFIDPNKVPNTKPWHLKVPGGETVDNLTQHLYNEHGVEKSLVAGWSLTNLRKLHAYCHNGYQLDDLYEYR